jgi:hypothetical protein
MVSASPRPSPSLPAPEALAAAGWQRCFLADEPRLSEAVETYLELGLELLLLPPHDEEARCSECLRAAPDRFRVIYTRARVRPAR